MLAVLHDLVCATSQLEVAGAAESGERAVELARTLRPDMVVIDLWMPGLGGLEAVKQIKASRPSTLVVLVSTTHPDDLTPEALASADAVIWKSELAPELLDELWLLHTDKD